MKLRLGIVLLAIITLAGCEKDDENGMDFKITGIRDTVIERGQSFQIPLSVFYLGGEKEKVTISASGNGGGVSIAYEPSTGEPDYALVQYIYANATADTGNYVITVTGTSESKKQFSKSFKLRVTEVVNSKPVIVLAQGDTVTHSLNSPWFDPGYTASDAEDGDLSSQIQVSGTVNVNLVGIYTISYSVTDSDGETTIRNRQVTVLNDITFVNGQYNVTTFSSGPNLIFTTTIASSTTQNNQFQLFKIGNNFQADPIINFNNNNDSIFMSSQTFMVGTVARTFEGKGKLIYNGIDLTIDLTYVETYFDSVSGQNVSQNKRDLCIQN